MLKNSFSRVAGQKPKIGFLALLMVMGAQVSAYALVLPLVPGGSTYAAGCSSDYPNDPGKRDACINGACQAAHLQDATSAGYDQCMANAEAALKGKPRPRPPVVVAEVDEV